MGICKINRRKEIKTPETIWQLGIYPIDDAGIPKGIVKMPSGIKKFSQTLFYNNKNIESFVYENPCKINEIEEGAFERSGITHIVIPEGVHVVSARAFAHCEQLTKIEFLGNITAIGDFAFFDCPNLQEIIIPNNDNQYIYNIGTNIFSESYKINQESIQSIINRFSITSISINTSNLLSGLPQLISITMPVDILKNCFSNCENLEEVKILKTVNQIEKITAFSNCNKLKTIYIDKECPVYELVKQICEDNSLEFKVFNTIDEEE